MGHWYPKRALLNINCYSSGHPGHLLCKFRGSTKIFVFDKQISSPIIDHLDDCLAWELNANSNDSLDQLLASFYSHQTRLHLNLWYSKFHQRFLLRSILVPSWLSKDEKRSSSLNYSTNYSPNDHRQWQQLRRSLQHHTKVD